MHPKLGKTLYFGLQGLRGIHIRSYLSWLESTQWLSTDELRQLQWRRLRRTIQHAYHHVPYYRAKWNALKLHPDQIRTPEDFQHLPLLTKQDVRNHTQELRADDARGRTFYRFTSGSTGVPLGIEHDANSRAAMWAAKYRGHRWHGIDVGEKTALVRGAPGKPAALRIKRLQDALMNVLRLFPHEISPQSVTAFYRQLAHWHPRQLEGYPAALHQMAKLLQELELDGRALGCQLVVTGGEAPHDFQRTCLQEVFGCRVADEYGCAEVGILAFECPAGRRHIPVENVYIETQPGLQGATELVFTGLVNQAMPFIRYQLGDLGILETEPCPCGRVAPTVTKLQGKNVGLVRTMAGRWIHDIVIRDLIYQIEHRQMGVEQIRFIQEPDASMAVDIVRETSFRAETVVYLEQAAPATPWRVPAGAHALCGADPTTRFRKVLLLYFETPRVDSGV